MEIWLNLELMKAISCFLTTFIFATSAMANFLPPQLPSPVSVGGSAATPFLICLFLITLVVGKLFILYPDPQHLTHQILTGRNPKQTVFVFDLNGVVFRFDPLLAIKDALTTTHKVKVLKAMFHPQLIWDILKLLHSNGVVEETILNISAKYPYFEEIIPLALKMANEQVPIIPTVELIKQIKKNNFRVFVFSNIGKNSAQILQNKYPEIFGLFDGILVTSPDDNYLMKPSEEAFWKFLNQFELEKEQLIFIDDKQSNIYAARKLGISAIQFFNPEQCRQLIQKILPLPN